MHWDNQISANISTQANKEVFKTYLDQSLSAKVCC